MTRELTAEERAAVGQRLKDGRARAAAERGTPIVSAEQVFLAENQNRAETTSEPLPDEGGEFASAVARAGELTDSSRNIVERVGAGRVIMYRRGAFGSEPRVISTNAIAQCFAAGWTQACADCGSNTCGVLPDGRMDANPNACPGKDPVQLRRCPVCSKRVYDVDTSTQRDEFADPNEIHDDAFALVTPESRTRARLEAHIIAYHQTEARQFGLAAADAQLVRAM